MYQPPKLNIPMCSYKSVPLFSTSLEDREEEMKVSEWEGGEEGKGGRKRGRERERELKWINLCNLCAISRSLN